MLYEFLIFLKKPGYVLDSAKAQLANFIILLFYIGVRRGISYTDQDDAASWATFLWLLSGFLGSAFVIYCLLITL